VRNENDHSRSSKAVDFDTNRKRVRNFLLVINSNFDPILHWFSENSYLTSIPRKIWGCFPMIRLPVLGFQRAKTLSWFLSV